MPKRMGNFSQDGGCCSAAISSFMNMTCRSKKQSLTHLNQGQNSCHNHGVLCMEETQMKCCPDCQLVGDIIQPGLHCAWRFHKACMPTIGGYTPSTKRTCHVWRAFTSFVSSLHTAEEHANHEGTVLQSCQQQGCSSRALHNRQTIVHEGRSMSPDPQLCRCLEAASQK